MDLEKLQYLPLALPHFSLLALIFIALVAGIEVQASRSAYLRMGLGRPVPGLGIALPVFVPPLSAAAVGIFPTGILAVLIASIFAPSESPDDRARFERTHYRA
jgi:uncharacterized membrane protein